MGKKNLFLLTIALALLGMSFYSFYETYQLRDRYQKAIETLYSEPDSTRFIIFEEFGRPAVEAYNHYFTLYLFSGLVFIASATIVLMFRTKLIFLDLSKLLAQLKLGINSFTLGIIIVLGLLVISGFFFYRAYGVWSEYQRIIVIPEILTIVPPPGVTIIESYVFFLPLYLFGGLVALESAIIVIMLQTKLIYLYLGKPLGQLQLGVKRFNCTLGIAMLGLLIISISFFCGAFDLWNKYQSPLQESFVLPDFPSYRIVKAEIEAYEKLFLPYLIGGLVTILLASAILGLTLRRQKPLNF